MSNPIHSNAVSSAMAGHVPSELLQFLHMQAANAAAERKESREETREMVIQASQVLTGLLTMLRADRKEAGLREEAREDARREKEEAREKVRAAAKNALATSDLVDEIVELKARIRGYESDVKGMTEALRELRAAKLTKSQGVGEGETWDQREVRKVQEAKLRVRGGIGQRIVRPYAAAASVAPAAEENKENYW